MGIDYRDVQAFGRRIGVELSDAHIAGQEAGGYPGRRWDYALHELGHLALRLPKGRPPRFWMSGAAEEEDPTDHQHPDNEEWLRFRRDLPSPWQHIIHPYSSCCPWYVLPSEWTVQSWCFEVAKGLGWITADEAEELLDDCVSALRMFWGAFSEPEYARRSLLGTSAAELSHEKWTLRKRHALNLDRLKVFGVDFAQGQLVPTMRPRAMGPYLELLDPFGRVQHRLPMTAAPEAAPMWWALWNWHSAYGEMPPGFDPYKLWGDRAAPLALEWAELLNTALVKHAMLQRKRLEELLHSLKERVPAAGAAPF